MNSDEFLSSGTVGALSAEVRVSRGLSSVFSMMALGIALAAVCAGIMMRQPYLLRLLSGWLGLALFGLQLVMVFSITKVAREWGSSAARLAFYGIAGTMGLTMAPFVSHYSGGSVVEALALAAVVLLLSSWYGFITKKAIAKIEIPMIALIGLIIALLVNAFLRNPIFQFVIDSAAVLLFAALTAWDVQDLRNKLSQADETEVDTVVVFGALNMWLNFANLFQSLLSLTGNRK